MAERQIWRGGFGASLRVSSVAPVNLKHMVKRLGCQQWTPAEGVIMCAAKAPKSLDPEWLKRVDRQVEATSRDVQTLTKNIDEHFGKIATVNKGFEGHQSNLALGYEEEVSKGVKNFLTNGKVLKVGYKWKGNSNEIDLVVVGDMGGEPVVVLGEVKTNMKNKWEKAVDQAIVNKMFYISLVERMPGLFQRRDDGTLDDEDNLDLIDVKELQLVGNEHRRVIIALGGALFPEDTKELISKRLSKKKKKDFLESKTEWLCVQMVQVFPTLSNFDVIRLCCSFP